MIQATVSRLGELVVGDRVLIVTNQRLVDAIRQQLPDLPAESVLGEPCKRDTAPCIGVAAALVSRNDPDAIMAVMPADHVIATDEVFQKAILQAVALIEENPTRLITFGIKPTYPSESFGYIEYGEPVAEGAMKVIQFREKPNVEVAKQYLASGTFFWNSGIFVWKAQTILDLLERYEPEMYTHISAIGQAMDGPRFYETFRMEFEQIRGTSIDYAVMERAEEVAVIEAPFEWDDVGSWTSLARLRGTDDLGNTVVGNCLHTDTKNSILRSEGDHLIAAVGVEDLIIVHTDNATLVANRHDEESVRKIVHLLEEKGMGEYM